MPTLKKRINMTADPSIERALIRAARRDHLSIAAKAIELIRIALELEEDNYFATVAKSRAKERVTYRDHASVWR